MISQDQETSTELKTLQESDLQLSFHLPPAFPLTMLNLEKHTKISLLGPLQPLAMFEASLPLLI
jgi:hypothetical protein